MDFAHQAAPALDVAGELFDELGITGSALGSSCVLLAFGHGQGNRQEVTDVQRHRFDQNALIPLQAVKLARPSSTPTALSC